MMLNLVRLGPQFLVATQRDPRIEEAAHYYEQKVYLQELFYHPANGQASPDLEVYHLEEKDQNAFQATCVLRI